jgi:hypothetical protein
MTTDQTETTQAPSSVERRLAAAEQILVGHLAEALLDGKSEEVRTWARSLAHELRREGIDLREAISARFTEIALDRLSEDQPF